MGKGTDRRGNGLPRLYKKKLEPLDRLYHQTADGQIGPLVSIYGKLESLVVVPWGEGSKDLHSLVKTLAESRVACQARSKGREASDNELGVVVAQVRKYLHQGPELVPSQQTGIPRGGS